MATSVMRVKFAAAWCVVLAWRLPATAQDRTVELLQKLSDAPGPPGLEEPIRRIMLDFIKPYADSIQFDGLGSIIAKQGSQGPRIMVDAHMDELGGMVRRITPKGEEEVAAKDLAVGDVIRIRPGPSFDYVQSVAVRVRVLIDPYLLVFEPDGVDDQRIAVPV